jgi:hypothetical protein
VYAAQASAATAEAGLNRRSGRRAVPQARLAVTRPPGRNLEVTIRMPARGPAIVATARLTFRERLISRGPTTLRASP